MKRSRFELVPKVMCKNGRFWIFRTLVMIEKSVSTVMLMIGIMIPQASPSAFREHSQALKMIKKNASKYKHSVNTYETT